MYTRPVIIEILELSSEYVIVKLPFLNVPVKMNHSFVESRLKAGYFVVKDTPLMQVAS